MSKGSYFMTTLMALFSFLAISCTSNTKHVEPPLIISGADSMLIYNSQATNSAETLTKPYVILVSIDGYRYDYNKLFAAPNLNRLAADGVQAESMKSIYPSKTFPNHYSLVTGLYADHQGIVSNEFFDPARGQTYSLPDRKTVEDGTWYFGEPLWITAELQGMLTASYFWVGSEANIKGMNPNYFFRYDSKVPYENRVDQVLAWLKLAPEKRPHFITLYFESVDNAAHQYGVNSEQTREAVMRVDAMIGRLRDGVAATGLAVNIVVVSDHGMQDLDKKKVIVLDESPDVARILAKFQTFGRGPQMLLYLNKGEDRSVIVEAQKILAKRAGKKYRVWRRDQMARFNYSSTPRSGDLVIEPEIPYVVGTRARPPVAEGANHGWDPNAKAMQGIFYANGPAFKERSRIPTFENINVYPLLLEILGLQQRVPIDGHLENIQNALKH
jgi:predicted AlkP superfamily pyrophosphatase or phosphodiesterase